MTPKHIKQNFAIASMSTALFFTFFYLTYQSTHTASQTVQELLQKTQAAGLNKSDESNLLKNIEMALQKKEYARVVVGCRELLATNPSNTDVLAYLAQAYDEIGEHDKTEHALQKFIALKPDNATAHYQLGKAIQQQNRFDEAATWYTKASVLAPDNLDLNLSIAQQYEQLGTNKGYDLAIATLDTLMKHHPDNLNLLLKRGNIEHQKGDLDTAITTYKLLVERAPTASNAHIALGQGYERKNMMELAKHEYLRAIELAPNNAGAHVALAGAYFMTGDYEKGFKEYEWRWHLSNMRNLPLKWDGSDPFGKTIILLSENGLGDAIQFVRFAQTLKNRGAKVVVQTSKALKKLLANCSYIDQLIEIGSPLPPHDAITSLQSVPGYLNISTNNLPAPPYMFASHDLQTAWQQKLAADKNFKVGLCWQSAGELGHIPQGRRSVPLAEFAELATIKGVSFYSLQKGPALEQLQNLPKNFKVIDFGDNFDEEHGGFMDTSAVMKNLDLIISVDTSVAHLAGALGVKTWTLLPLHPDPRWMLARSNSPWYPTMTLFRQEKTGDWSSTIKTIQKELQKTVSQKWIRG